MDQVIQIGARTYEKTSRDQFEIPLIELSTMRLNDVPPYSTLEILHLPIASDFFRVTLSVLHAGGPGKAGDYSLSLKIFFEVNGSPDDMLATAKVMRIKRYLQRTFEAAAQDRRFSPGPDWTPFFYSSGHLLCVESFYREYDWEENPLLALEVEPFASQLNDLSNFRDTLLFVCHASEDKPFVDSLCAFLDSSDVPVWYDRREIRVGDSIVQRVSDALGVASHLVIVLSRAAVTKPWVRKEFSAALMRQLQDSSIRVLPVLVEDCKIPPLIADLRYADFRADSINGFDELLAALR